MQEAEKKLAVYVSDLESSLGRANADQGDMADRLLEMERLIRDKDIAYKSLAARLDRMSTCDAEPEASTSRRARKNGSDAVAQHDNDSKSDGNHGRSPDGEPETDVSSATSATSEQIMTPLDENILTPPQSCSTIKLRANDSPEERLKAAELKIAELEAALAEHRDEQGNNIDSIPPSPRNLSPRWRSSTSQPNPFQTWSGFPKGEGKGARPKLERLSLSAQPSSLSLRGYTSASLLTPKLARQSLPALRREERSVPSMEAEIRQLQDTLKEREDEIMVLEDLVKSQQPDPRQNDPHPSPEKQEHEMDQGPTGETDSRGGTEVPESTVSASPAEEEIAANPSDSTENRVTQLMSAFAAKEVTHGNELSTLRDQISRLEDELNIVRDRTAGDQSPQGPYAMATDNDIQDSSEPAVSVAESQSVHEPEIIERPQIDLEAHHQALEEMHHAQDIMATEIDGLRNELHAKFSELSDTKLMMEALSNEKVNLEDKVVDLQNASALSQSELSDTKLTLEALVNEKRSLLAEIAGHRQSSALSHSELTYTKASTEALASQKEHLARQLATAQEGVAKTQADLAEHRSKVEVLLEEKTALADQISNLQSQQQLQQQDAKSLPPTTPTPVFTTRMSLSSRSATPTQKGIPPIGPPPGMPPPLPPSLDIPGSNIDGSIKRSSAELASIRRRPSVPNMSNSIDGTPSPTTPSGGQAERMFESLRAKEEELKVERAKMEKLKGDLKASGELITSLESSLATSEKSR